MAVGPRTPRFDLVRRFIAAALLVVFGLPFAQSLFALTSKSEANLPACCRRSGKHHCMMSMAERMQLASRDPQFQAPAEKCPYCPATIVMVHGNTFVPPTTQAIFADLTAPLALVAETKSKLHISGDRSHQKRGPPASLSL